jgi:hypothetical protein
MLLYVECHTYPNTLHLTPKDRPLIVDLLQQVISPARAVIHCSEPLREKSNPLTEQAIVDCRYR